MDQSYLARAGPRRSEAQLLDHFHSHTEKCRWVGGCGAKLVGGMRAGQGWWVGAEQAGAQAGAPASKGFPSFACVVLRRRRAAVNPV